MSADYVAIVDYRISNLHSVENACLHVGLNPVITSDPDQVSDAAGLILPGVGAFGDAMNNLDELGLVSAIKDYVQTGRPFLGICLGLQLLFEKSEEFGEFEGLGLIKGNVVGFKSLLDGEACTKIPHMGWSQIRSADEDLWNASPLNEIENESFMYFVHSFCVVPEKQDVILTTTTYGGVEYCSSVMSGNIFATQFHPEKSAQKGIKIYREWANLLDNGKE